MEPYDQKPNYTNYHQPRHTGKIVLAVVAVAAVALAVGVANNPPESLTPVTQTEETAMGGPMGVYDDQANSASSIEPAEGEAFRENKAPAPTVGGTAVAPAVQPPGATTTNPTPPASPDVPTATSGNASPAMAVPPPTQKYGTEQECKDATSTACHATECSTAKALADCPAAEQKSWEAVVPAMDQTAVPEQVNPPLTGQ
jgi:hypothetical protein